MRVGIHRGPKGKFSDFVKRYETILKYNDIESIRLDAGAPDFWDRVKTCDLFIYNWRVEHDDHQLAKVILPMVEWELKIKCFPDHNTSWHYDDKLREYYLLKLEEFPVIDSWIFWDRERALEWAKTASYPVVFKLKGGASAHNVVLVKTRREAETWIMRMFGRGLKTGTVNVPDGKGLRRKIKRAILRLRGEDSSPFWRMDKNYAYFQRFLPGNDYDTRVVVIGDRAMGFRRYNRENDFRASGSKNYDLNPEHVDREFIKLGFEISKKMKFQSMAYDFIYDQDGKPGLIEISYTFPDHTLIQCPGYWDSNMNWHEGQHWPQYFQLMDTLNKPGLRQP